MEFNKYELEVLSEGSEDWIGLYEVLWSYRVQCPNSNDKERVGHGKKALRRLYKDGLTVFHIRKWGEDGPDDDSLREMEPEEVEELFKEEERWFKSWSESDALPVTFTNTEKGDKVYFSLTTEEYERIMGAE